MTCAVHVPCLALGPTESRPVPGERPLHLSLSVQTQGKEFQDHFDAYIYMYPSNSVTAAPHVSHFSASNLTPLTGTVQAQARALTGPQARGLNLMLTRRHPPRPTHRSAGEEPPHRPRQKTFLLPRPPALECLWLLLIPQARGNLPSPMHIHAYACVCSRQCPLPPARSCAHALATKRCRHRHTRRPKPWARKARPVASTKVPAGRAGASWASPLANRSG